MTLVLGNDACGKLINVESRSAQAFRATIRTMAPKKRDRKADAEPAAKRPRTCVRQAMEGAAGQTVASQDVVVALAGALDKSAAAMPPIRKVILEGEQVASVYDAIVALAGCAAKNAVVVF